MNNIYPENAILMAPLAGYTDLPYRRSFRRHEAHYIFTEMVDASSLIYAERRSRKFLDRGKDEKWLGLQLVGSNLEEIEKAIEIVNRHEFSILDINMGCPTPKVVKKGKGAGLAKDPDHAAKIAELMVMKSRFPVTAKIRIQDENDPEPTIRLSKKLEETGIRALTIHGRLMHKVYSGECHANIISAVREALGIQVIANGGVMDSKSMEDLKEESGCSETMVARGAMGNPWIFEFLQNKRTGPVTTKELVAEMEQHIMDVVDYYDNESFALKISRKFILDYLSGRGYGGKLKSTVSSLSTVEDFQRLIEEVKKGPSERFLIQQASLQKKE